MIRKVKVLVTGGAGFIGSHICRLLLDQGHQVVVYDNLSRGYEKLVDQRSTLVRGDLKDQGLMEEALKGCDAVIHMAALALVTESVKDPGLYADNNVLGTISLLEAMKNVGVKKVIFSSSCVVYGNPKSLPVKEDEAILAYNPYGATKVASENFLNSYHSIHGFDVTLLRYFNPYGPNEMHDPETHAVPNFIKAALNDEEMPLYWKGEQIRDFIYVEDLAQAHIDVLKLSGWNVFNVGTENGTKVKEVVDTIGEILGKELRIKDLGERSGDVPAVYASSQKLKEATGWSAKHTLKEGLEKTVEWFRKQ